MKSFHLKRKTRKTKSNMMKDYYNGFVVIGIMLFIGISILENNQHKIIKQNERIIHQNDSIKKELVEVSKVIFD